MSTRTELVRMILSAAVLTSTATLCQARFANMPTAPVQRADDSQPDAAPVKAPQTAAATEADTDQAEASPIVSQKSVPLGGGRYDLIVLKGTRIASPDSAHVAYKQRWGEEFQYTGYGMDGENSVGVAELTDPTFAPDSRSIAVVLRESGWHLQHLKLMLKGYEPVTPIRFSPDGRRLIYLARHENQRFVVEGDQPQPMAETVVWDQLVFTADSTVLAYPAFDGKHWRMVINGDPGPAWDSFVTPPVIAPQGSRVLYVAMKHGRYFVVDRHTTTPGGNTGGGSGKGGFRLIESPPVISDDGKSFVYWAMSDDRRWHVYKNHRPVPGYDADRPGQLVISPDGNTLAAILKRNNQWHVVHDGVQSPAYTAVGAGSLTLSPDATRLAYAVKATLGWAVVADNKQQQTYLHLAANSLAFSPDSSHLAYAALAQGQWSVILDSQAHQPFSQIDASTFVFSPDSNHLAYLAHQMGLATVVMDNQVVGEYDHAQQFTFSPKSDHLVWLATQDEKSFLVVDGTPGDATFDQLVPGANIQFASDIACHSVALSWPGPSFYRIELRLAPIPKDEPAPSNDSDGTPGTPAPLAPAEPLSPFVDVPTE